MIEVRPASDDEIGAVIEVATLALCWDRTDPNEAFFRWKHLDNPAGRSPMWVAVEDDEIVGLRTFIQWRFATESGPSLRAVRAVDTATHPDHQRKGIFRSLTETAVEELTTEGVDFVFNTPNSSSRPGYLRFGWTDEGRVPIRILPAGPGAVVRIARARTAAAKWSEPCTVGRAAADAADDLGDLGALAGTNGTTTERTTEHLTWRYGFEPLHYRVITDDRAGAVVRVRRRGSATEGVIAELFASQQRDARQLVRRLSRELDVDYLITTAAVPAPRPPMIPVPGLGPELVVRDLASTAPRPPVLRFSLGDLELF